MRGGGKGHLEQGSFSLTEDRLRESLSCELPEDSTPASKKMISERDLRGCHLNTHNNEELADVRVCECMYICVWEGIVQIFLIISIGICLLHKKILFLSSYAI